MRTVKMHMTTNARLVGKVLTKYKNTFFALKELINNSLIAKAKCIEINLIPTEGGCDNINYHPIEAIQIIDNGHGVPFSEFQKSIMEVGTDNRLEGYGVGRFSALQIGKVMSIYTTAYDPNLGTTTTTEVTVDVENLQKDDLQSKNFDVTTDEKEGNYNSCYTVTISSLYHNENECPKRNKLSKEFFDNQFAQKIFEQYPIYIFNEEVKFIVNGKELKKIDFITEQPKCVNRKYTDVFGKNHNVTFTFYSLRLLDQKVRLFLQTSDGELKTTSLELAYNTIWYAPTMGAQFVTIESDFITRELCDDFLLKELGEKEWEKLSVFLKETVDEHYKKGNVKYKAFLEKLQADKGYPFTQDEIRNSTLPVDFFNQSAFIIEEELKVLEKNNNSRELIYALLKQVIEDGNLSFLINNVMGLSNESRCKLMELLDKTNLEDVINFSSDLADRLTTIDLLQEITVSNLANNISQRNAVYKIIKRELWMFGEEYNRMPCSWSDIAMENALNELFLKYVNYKPTNKDQNLIGGYKNNIKAIPNQYLYHERKLGSEQKEYLIINMKTPSCLFNQKEISNLDRYIYDLEINPQFVKRNTTYKIYFIANRISDYARTVISGYSPNSSEPYLCKHITSVGKDIKVYILEWSELIAHNRNLLSYMSETLKTKKVDAQTTFLQEYADMVAPKNRGRLVLQR